MMSHLLKETFAITAMSNFCPLLQLFSIVENQNISLTGMATDVSIETEATMQHNVAKPTFTRFVSVHHGSKLQVR